ncbi:4-(cytidine 5'-diphospho)-2-C-methyl-D-erythritol kinase [Polymorphum gilvum]|nr:4-(cytidine 5'-diphospho)-2-C-methyl-D-erythritol kinase [Polymorphum gilvum]
MTAIAEATSRTPRRTSSDAEFARAKVNLALHVTGQRADGYHLLDSLAVFPDIGDRLRVSPAKATSLVLSGPFADALEADDPDNLVLKAGRLFFEHSRQVAPPLRFALEKNLPVASGIGGGSADAAACLRLLADRYGRGRADAALVGIALALGADVPACLAQRPCRLSGIGERLDPAPPLPEIAIVLVNPGVGVSTPAVFRALETRDNPPLPAFPERFATPEVLLDWLRATRNDLQPAAMSICPAIGTVLDALDARPETLFARMSGSGATCFALCRPADAGPLHESLARDHPDWWIACGTV